MTQDFSLSSRVLQRIEQSSQLATWLDNNKPSEMFSEHFGASLAAGYFSLALEHHIAVIMLMRNALPSSAFALLRSVLDAYWRGEWASKVASEADLERFRQGKFDPTPDSTLKVLRSSHPEIGDQLELIKRANWSALSGFTHGGFSQMSRQLSEGYIGPRFSDEECIRALGFADNFAAISGVSLAEIAGMDTTPFEQKAKGLISL